nr:hypothetical protein [Candidatus Sigynarchaeota archaeon]
MSRAVSNKQMIVWIFVLLTTLVVILSLLSYYYFPFYFYDDIVYYIALAIAMVLICSCMGKKGWNNESGGIPGLFTVSRRKWCDACKGALPLNFKPGNYCPHCGAFIAYEKTNNNAFKLGSESRTWDDGYPDGRVPAFKPSRRGKKKSPREPIWKSAAWRDDSRRRSNDDRLESESEEMKYTGYEHAKKAPGKNAGAVYPGDMLVPENERRGGDRFHDSENNPENSPFKPPFDDLFKNQNPIKSLFKRFLNWAAVGINLRRWVKQIQENPQLHAIGDNSPSDALAKLRSDAEIDAVAKLEAWKVFERNGFDDPLILPALYRKEIKKQEEKDQLALSLVKKVASCPDCGSVDYDFEPDPATKENKFRCKKCGRIYMQKRSI